MEMTVVMNLTLAKIAISDNLANRQTTILAVTLPRGSGGNYGGGWGGGQLPPQFHKTRKFSVQIGNFEGGIETAVKKRVAVEKEFLF